MRGRLNVGYVIAFVAAVALMLFTAMDWYSTMAGEEARRLEEAAEPTGGRAVEPQQDVEERAREFAESQERNAWQADGTIDRLVLVVTVAAAVLALLSVMLAAAGRPAGWVGGTALTAATVGAFLLTYRMLQEPGLDESTTVEPGAPLALIALGLVALGGSLALREQPATVESEEPAGPRRGD